jgi:hypothetical protein
LPVNHRRGHERKTGVGVVDDLPLAVVDEHVMVGAENNVCRSMKAIRVGSHRD